MNKTFLEYVAKDIINKYGTDLSRIAVVFPNKRAALFLSEYLARIAGKPVWSPAYITISDLFRQHTDLKLADPIKLICDIHKSFIKCTGISETLDHFYGWGQLLLADFDDIDKNMADAKSIFSNLKDIHELDDISYLDNEQKEILKRFFANFNDDIESELKQRFLSLWSHFGDIYHDYNLRLTKQGIGYEGAIYRKVVSQDTLQMQYDKYLFVGFNLLQKVERTLFCRLMKEDKAKFYWDFDEYYMKPSQQASSPQHYFSEYLASFPNELDNTAHDIYANMRRPKHIRFISSPTENAQARFASNWLLEDDHYRAGRKTAIVLCDENILLPLMHSLPPEADKVNITSGFPLSMTPIASLVMLLFDLYTLGLRKKGTAFNPHYMKKLMAHPYYHLLSEELLSSKGASSAICATTALLQLIAALVKQVGIATKQEADALTQESVFRMFTILNRLIALAESGDLVVDNTTLRRLVSQLVGSSSIPFHGEPVVGVQIMGVLETRNLDFDNVLLLSCNEGNMPKGVNDSSFIPYSIRKAHGLTTIDNKVAIYSYYFHRLLQRADNITIAYNNSTDNGHTGEMSRFMLQLLVESGQQIGHYNLTTENHPIPLLPKAITKDETIISKLESMRNLSPSAINTYIRCKLAFYYQYITRIKEPDGDPETIDNRMFGNIFHKSAFLVYRDIMERSKIVEKEHIQAYLSNRKLLTSVVDRAFKEEECKINNGLQIINREVLIEYLTKLLKIDLQLCPFNMLAMEEDAKVYTKLEISTPEGKRYDVSIGGIIDRLDAIVDKTGKRRIRVVDYKTGNPPSGGIKSIEEVFDSKNISTKHSNYYLQAILYSIIVSHSEQWNEQNSAVSPALLFIKNATTNDYDPTLTIDKHPINDVTEYEEVFIEKLKETIADIFSTHTAFTPTDDRKKCELCPYRMICGL